MVSPRPEPLVLETRRDGQVVARDQLGPRGNAVRIDATVWQARVDALRQCTDAGLTADGVVQIECALRDARGELANGERVISAEIDDGELLGVENGDLSDNAPYRQQRSTFNGRVIVFVRPSGPATVRRSAPGLPDVTLQCG